MVHILASIVGMLKEHVTTGMGVRIHTFILVVNVYSCVSSPDIRGLSLRPAVIYSHPHESPLVLPWALCQSYQCEWFLLDVLFVFVVVCFPSEKYENCRPSSVWILFSFFEFASRKTEREKARFSAPRSERFILRPVILFPRLPYCYPKGRRTKIQFWQWCHGISIFVVYDDAAHLDDCRSCTQSRSCAANLWEFSVEGLVYLTRAWEQEERGHPRHQPLRDNPWSRRSEASWQILVISSRCLSAVGR